MVTKVESLVDGLGVGTTILSRLVKKAKRRGLKVEHVHLLVKDDERTDLLIDQMSEKMVDVLVQAFLWNDIQLIWNKFYKEVIGMDADFSGVAIPAKYNPASHWLFGIAQGLDYSRLQEAICLWEKKRNRPAPYFYQNLATIQKEYEQRPSEKNYFVVSGNHIVAIDGDAHLAGKSNRNIHDEKLPVQNAMERLVLGLFVDWMACQNGGVQLLDQKGWTRTCSRWIGGAVYVFRDDDGRLGVHWSVLGGAGPAGRARAVDSVL